MTGGLIQLVTSGKQDVSLTYNPQITFFKKVYRRHTNFSLEIKEIYPDQQPDYENVVSFTLDNADLLHRCFIQIDLPQLSFNDSTILNENYLNWKVNYLQRLTNNINKWKTLYINLQNYASIQLMLYQQLQILFLSDNITLITIQDYVIRFNNSNKIKINLYSNLIDVDIYNKINMSTYLLGITQLLTYSDVAPSPNYITLSSIKTHLDNQYKIIYEYLTYYHTNWKDSQKKYDVINSNKVNFAWNEFLGNFYFTQFELEIGGQVVEQYSSDQLHIYQMHNLIEDKINNYYNMIGHIESLNKFNNLDKPGKTLIVPLLFWFCRRSGSSLPLVAMRNTSVNINLTLNKLKYLLYFIDYENEYNNFLSLTLPIDTSPNTNLNYESYKYNVDAKTITYNLININYEALSHIYNSLKSDDLNFILNTYGILYNNKYVLTLNEWIIFKNDLKNNQSLMIKIGGYENYLDYNYLLNLIPKPNIKLLCENVFIDDVERNKFASSKLEYIVDMFQENIFDINNLTIFDGTISIDKPSKYINWMIQPKTFLYGLSQYSKVTPYVYDFSKYFKNTIFNKQSITLNQLEHHNTYLYKSFYSYVLGFKTLNRILPDGVYYYNYAIYPEDQQPSGTANFSIITEKKIKFDMNQNFLQEYFNSKLNPSNVNIQLKVLSLNYNLFVIHEGIGRLVFIN